MKLDLEKLCKETKNDNKIDLKNFCAEVGLNYVKDNKGEYGCFDGKAVMSIFRIDSDIYHYCDVLTGTEDVRFIHTKSVYNDVFNYPVLKEEISSLIERYKEACIKFKLKKMEKDFV